MKRKNVTWPKAAGSILFETLRQMGLGSSLARQSIVTRWPKIVDSVIAKRARAERLMGDTLYVVVDSSVWMNELAAMKSVLLDKLNSSLEPGVPRIRDIKFTQLSWNRESHDEHQSSPTRRKALPPDKKALEISTQSIDAIKDPDIRRVIERLIEKDACFKANHNNPV
ncbi:MAG: DUF721 domain-containing protein [Deltaproteobacteria bacterium]|nr:DUF721 domain-containing protein [Deltaproteobacteria bacterium]